VGNGRNNENITMKSRSKWLCLLPFAALWMAGAAHAAIPASERQALLNLYNDAGGSGWIHNGGWIDGSGNTGAAGTECGDSSGTPPWYGVTCDSSNSHVVVIYLPQNGLVGTLPDLSALTYLQSLILSSNNNCTNTASTSCALGGTIPATLGSMTNLVGFSIEGDAFTGSIPALGNLSQLQGFDVSENSLSGSIPSLSGLISLQGFNVANNELTGSIPSLSGLSNLLMFDVDNNELSGSIPSLSGLTNLQSFYVFSNQLTGSLPSLAALTSLQFFNANDNQLNGSIPTLAGLSNLQYFAVHGNQLTGPMPALYSLTALTGIDVGGNQLTGNVPVAPNPDNLQGGGSILCGNEFSATPDANWDAATGISPWYSACGLTATTINLDQFGLTGSWYNPQTSGQGLLLTVYADSVATGQGGIGAGWYTFDNSGNQRWYVLSGAVNSNSGSTTLVISTATDGNLAAAPSVSASQVGTATLSFSDCSTGTLVYAFNDGRSGSIPLSRLGSNVNCGTSGNTGAASANYPLSGTWYDPNHSGQGFFFSIIPGQSNFGGGWYTFYPSNFSAASPRQQWFVFDTSFAPTATSMTDAPLVQTLGGNFNVAGYTSQPTVGSISISFQSCTQATATYTISPSSANGSQSASGTIDLVRLGPTPAGCSLP
jgi:hypothetical protein